MTFNQLGLPFLVRRLLRKPRRSGIRENSGPAARLRADFSRSQLQARAQAGVRWLLIGLLACRAGNAAAQTARPKTDLVLATVRISNPKSTATAFIVHRPAAEAGQLARPVLVTAAHALERSEGEEMSVLYRRQEPDGTFAKAPVQVKVRKETTPLWTKHATQDVAVLPIEPPPGINLPVLSLDCLANDDDLKSGEPGDLVRCIGFPHGAVFEPNAAGFPVVRLGCIAGYPLVPAERQSLLVDYNTFEGDSGGLVYWEKPDATGKPACKILGLIQGQHMFNQRYEFPYETGEFRKQLGLAIVVQARAIRETIGQLPPVDVVPAAP